MAKTIYETIYDRLQAILPEVENPQGDYLKLSAPGYMDLHVDILRRESGRTVISLAHNGRQNGDVMADPDMEVAIVPSMKMAEALTYQNDYVGVFHRVYPAPGKVAPRAKRDLNQFLAEWLLNLAHQGHKLSKTSHEAA